MRLLIFTFFSFQLVGQIGTGEWRLHVPSTKAIDVAAGDGLSFAAFENGMVEYDVNAKEISLWTDVNGLSDINLTTLLFHSSTNSLFIGYDDGNFDKLSNGKITKSTC